MDNQPVNRRTWMCLAARTKPNIRTAPDGPNAKNRHTDWVAQSVSRPIQGGRMTTSPLVKFRLDGQVAVITGGARGIGRATAELFAAAGARVAIVDRDGEEASRAAAAITASGARAEAHALDVTDEAAVEAVFGAVAGGMGRIDILVNNAGASIRKPTIELAKADWDAVVAVNMTAVFLCSKAAARHMLADGRGGAIVNVASILGFSGARPNIAYQATKGPS